MQICSACGLEKSLDDFYRGTSRGKSRIFRECKACSILRARKSYQSNRAERRKKANAYMTDKRQRTKDAVFAAYGGYVCACCGETQKEFLSLDHINNDGNKHRKGITGKRHFAGFHTYSWLAKNGFPSGYQVLCMNCNWGKRFTGICPHKARCNDYPQGVGSSEPKRSTPDLTLVVGKKI
jgi:hypothetical protein